MNKQMYGKEFCSKRQFLKWLEENEDKIEWEDGVEFSWYYKDEEVEQP
jgi:hypothetical protein